jgi:hypothetical protein
MYQSVVLLLKYFVVTVLCGNTDVSVSHAQSSVYYGDGEDDISCCSRKCKAKTRGRRCYSLGESSVNVNHERWNQPGFDSRPVTPPLSEHQRGPDELKRSSVGRRRRSLVDSFVLK